MKEPTPAQKLKYLVDFPNILLGECTIKLGGNPTSEEEFRMDEITRRFLNDIRPVQLPINQKSVS